MSEEGTAGPSVPAPENLGMEELLRLLSCEKCQQAARNPKLLPCLHTLCTECLEENKPIGQCPTCMTPFLRAGEDPVLDNLFFVTLQAKLNTYKKIAGNQELMCSRCQVGAEFWCSECEEFLCMQCYNAHQWYLKQKSHEVQKLCDLKNATAPHFLEGAKKSSTLFCSEPTHNNQLVSIYCRGCCKPLCCSCALLDGEHYKDKLYCDIHVEIKERKDELSRIKEELAEKKRNCRRIQTVAYERLQQLERVCTQTQDEIREKVEEMVRWIRQKGEELLLEVDGQRRQEGEEVERKLQCTDRIVKRMESSEQLVEKMNLFASDQEVMEMHPFIQQSLEELRNERLPTIQFQGQVENFAEVLGKMNKLLQRVKGGNDAVCPGTAPAGNCEVPHEDGRQPRLQGGMSLPTPTYTITLPKTSQGFGPFKRCVSCANEIPLCNGHDCCLFCLGEQHQARSSPEGKRRMKQALKLRFQPLHSFLWKKLLKPFDPIVTEPTLTPVPRSESVDPVLAPTTPSPKKKSNSKAVSMTSPQKRAIRQREKGIQASPKRMKLEDHEQDAGETSSWHVQKITASSPSLLPDASAPEREQRGAGNPAEVLQNAPLEVSESEAASIVISSSEENEDDCMVSERKRFLITSALMILAGEN
nr:protein PML isoform X1 [Pogona vitticeps]XP_020659452.1 protein PML isoform X1 [Pogona vitticeps]XP_020659453.1 protein PML isoform X1 [Pogona vitticeps]XP_020659454.1 protein PML isoform X1 [Pogona vitticeps]XP_020659456.1 protein PML isoform X1 [Pogona vitticeps]